MAVVERALDQADESTVRPAFSLVPVSAVSFSRCPSTLERIAQRMLDLVVATVLVVAFSIPILLIAVVVRLTSRGPTLFVHERVGRDGEVFELVKFRTMRPGTYDEVRADPVSCAFYRANGFKLAEDDPRITQVGRVLRRTSLDELPQLWNVLKGDMSIVGVRPLVCDELAERPVSDQWLYERYRPGITGLWQVEGRSSILGLDRLGLDRRYLQDRSLSGDIEILLRTPAALLRLSEAK